MTTAQENLHRIALALEEEHKVVRAQVDKLAAQETTEGLLPILDELHGLLMKHFAHEQYPGGLYEVLAACAPEHAEDLRILIDQHFLLMSHLQSARQRAREGDGATALRRDAEDIVGLIRAHERREQGLINTLLGA